MGCQLTRAAYEQLIAEDLDWLLKQPRTLERDHIALIVRRSPEDIYGLADKLFADIAHGDEEHRRWLRQKLVDFFLNFGPR